MEPFSIIKFLTGFNIFDGARLAKLIFIGVLIAIGIGIYHKTFVAPTYKTVQSIQIKDHQTVQIYPAQAAKKNKLIEVQLWPPRISIGF